MNLMGKVNVGKDLFICLEGNGSLRKTMVLDKVGTTLLLGDIENYIAGNELKTILSVDSAFYKIVNHSDKNIPIAVKKDNPYFHINPKSFSDSGEKYKSMMGDRKKNG